MSNPQTISELSERPKEATPLPSAPRPRREEPWASGQRKRYLASLDDADGAA
ncbi:hypothetical protein KQ304_05120 [Synechococcus sp. CS-1329]|uniref:hypothetical protein n=1 Tax=Synechococcus sp. CS-1329 TaxID=2847975 RepID=UPI00223B6326|nr:hypothetical protein [Synechococcus sp. CS-1329]MCT0218387.1 hypothetical protein [Synechococcus sp. CS-1329]